MSVLELNGRIFDASTTGTLTLTSEGGAATTDVTQGLAKSWGKFNGSTFGELDSFNVTGFVDNGTGDYSITIANDMANANYISLESSGANHTLNQSSNSTGLMNVKCKNSSHADADESRVCQGAWGDLA
tara:strand:- start:37 stop:423 length:387 start_codon:yes stop_codon:yes gene_type:complete